MNLHIILYICIHLPWALLAIENDGKISTNLNHSKFFIKINENEIERPGIIIQNSQDEQLNENISNDLTRFGGYAKILSNIMHSIINKELGLEIMQNRLNEFLTETSSINYNEILYKIVDKMVKKITEVHSLIEITGEKIEEMFQQQFTLNMTNFHLSCCDFYLSELRKDKKTNEFIRSLNENNNDLNTINDIKMKEHEIRKESYHYNNYFNSWVNTEFACDNGRDQKRQFFTPAGPNLTQQFKENLNNFPNTKWQYFMSFLDTHIEYPSYLPNNNYCFLRNLNIEPIVDKLGSGLNKKESDSSHSQRTKWKNKKHDSFYYHHKRVYNELNQLFMQRHRENLLASALPQPKMVILVIDHGSSLSEHQLNIAKSVSKYILNSLSHRDRVAIVDLTHVVDHPTSHICRSMLQLAYANYDTKNLFGKYIDELPRSHNATNHLLGFKQSFKIISANYDAFRRETNSQSEVFIAYISRGLLSSLADAKPVMEFISNELMKSSYSVVINCYALIDESKPIMYETTFLKEIAEMNFRKFRVSLPPVNKIRSGLMVALNNTDNLGFILNGIYTVLPKPTYNSNENQIYISLPHFDLVSKDTHISISKAFRYHDHLLGVAGADLSFFDFAEDIINYPYSSNSYVFLIDAYSGKLLYHPIFSYNGRLNNKNKKYNYNFNSEYLHNSFIIVEHVENALHNNHQLKQNMLTEENGEETVMIDSLDKHSSNETLNFKFLNDWQLRFSKYLSITYYWQRIASTSYIVVLTVYGKKEHSTSISLNGRLDLGHHQNKRLNRIINHRLDYLNNTHLEKIDLKLCRHFNQISTIDRASLFLSSNAFISSYHYEANAYSSDFIDNYMEYITTFDENIANPGLKSNIRSDVNIASEIVDQWKHLLNASDISKYVVRKYIATTSGAFILYPGTVLDDSYKPANRPWFIRAIGNRDKLILISPYLDVGGSGYIVTLSKAIYKKQSDPNGNHTDQIWAVIGIDLTLAYFHKLIDKIVPSCMEKDVSCFIMDDYGYLIDHSSFIKSPLIPFIERQHITHKEPQMINDLLNQKQFVRKLSCNSFIDRTVQRYYMFNSSLIGILTSISQDEHPCAKYKIISLDSTNIFFGMVNRTCDNSTTFCPCSLTDRLCLNCHRIEQTDCECPCECPLILKLCDGELENEIEDHAPSCLPTPEPLQEPNLPKHLFDSVDNCFNRDCLSRHSKNECNSMSDCEWCFIKNGNKLTNPFCIQHDLCIGNYIAKHPYLYNEYFQQDSYKITYSTPIGPFIIIACFLVFIISVYCFHFRFLTNRSSTNAPNEFVHRLPCTNEQNDRNQDEFNQNDGLVEALNAPLVQKASSLEIRSPYHINSNYQRKRIESDCGYSTMTQNDDLEPIYANPKIITTTKSDNLDLLDISTSLSNATTPSGFNDNLSTLSLPSIASSLNDQIEECIPSKSSTLSKVWTKSKCIESRSNKSKHLLDDFKALPVVDEDSLMNEII